MPCYGAILGKEYRGGADGTTEDLQGFYKNWFKYENGKTACNRFHQIKMRGDLNGGVQNHEGFKIEKLLPLVSQVQNQDQKCDRY